MTDAIAYPKPNLLTKEDLIAFEEEIANLFNLAKIRAPIHLYYGNEEQIIKIFQKIRPQDWVFCSWRSHYQCLLKGVPREQLRQEILDGRSISLCFPEYRIFSSAIVGGVLPISVGTAMSIKMRGEQSKVYCFMGEMTAETGIAYESIKYSRNHKLPIHFIVEDNEKSVCTDTREVWNQPRLSFEEFENQEDEYITYYRYETKYPHAGAGIRVEF
ncbi:MULTISPECIES: thiamine pyrophosphate-dependent enzyme [Spirulina sp. CCY15215]|uniref:thiamine pyrophosphate-dependent enzyme n=1 Tax=Spirulina sp. CCY15215 TaxID=2767591 RepID=UPI00194F64E1